MEPRFNEPLYDEVLDITNDFLYPINSKIVMKKNLDITKPRYGEQILSVEVPLYKKVTVSAVCIFHCSIFLCPIL